MKSDLIKKLPLHIAKCLVALLYTLILIGGGLFFQILLLIILCGHSIQITSNFQVILMLLIGGGIGFIIDYLITKLKLR